MTQLEILKGTQDCAPVDQIKINKVLDVIRSNFESFGFRPFDTPIIEMLSTLTLKYDDDAEIVGEIFKLSDRGERELGLRYDLTTPLSRFVAMNPHLKKPFRRYQIGKVFRDGPIKKGRLREFTQCDGDVIGVEGVEIEAEILNMFYSTYKELSINATIELNNNKILRGALLESGFNIDDLSSVILSIDKLKKIKLEGVLTEIKEKNLDEKKAKIAIDILSSKTFDEIKKIAKNEILIDGINELEKLVKYLKEQGVEYRINFSMSRGLDIYTGNIWEAYDLDRTISSSIGSGGRYDKVIGEYANNGKDYPAVGISFGLVPIIAVLDKKENGKTQTVTKILVAPLEKEVAIDAIKLANLLRLQSDNVEVFYGFKMKKIFDYCDYLGVEKLIILGKRDIENKEYILKDLKTKKEERTEYEF